MARARSADDWERLGRAIRRARRRTGFGEMRDWAARIGRSTRILQGLERGEAVGRDTLERIEAALVWPEGRADEILSGGDVVVADDGSLRFRPPGYQESAATIPAIAQQVTRTVTPPRSAEVVGLGLDDEARRRNLNPEQLEAVLQLIRNMGPTE